VIRRLFWLFLGISIGAAAVRRVTATARRYSPSGLSKALSESAGRLLDSAKAFVDDARQSAAQRQAELNEGAGLDGKLGAKPEDFTRK
jgi:hypothetical protein